MPYVRVPKDLTDFKSKAAFGLTSRQLVCWGSAAAIGLPTYLITSNITGNTDLASWLVIVLVAPLFAFSVVEKNGLPLEKFIGSFIRSRILGVPRRPYKATNIYEVLGTELYLDQEDQEDAEITQIEQQAKKSPIWHKSKR